LSIARQKPKEGCRREKTIQIKTPSLKNFSFFTLSWHFSKRPKKEANRVGSYPQAGSSFNYQTISISLNLSGYRPKFAQTPAWQTTKFPAKS